MLQQGQDFSKEVLRVSVGQKAAKTENDPIVCFRGLNYTPLNTVGGKYIYNFVYQRKSEKVECFQKSYEYFNNVGFFKKSNLSVHRLDNLKKNIVKFLEQ